MHNLTSDMCDICKIEFTLDAHILYALKRFTLEL